jgi:peptidoglycan/xylan/chitin deacetylase (PgdA/CDA1 family)
MLRPLFQWMSPAGPRARLQVLLFHRVPREPDPLFPEAMHARQFDRVCGWLRDWCNVLPLDEAVQRLAAGTLPARALAISFDDGYADNCEVALPILQAHGLPACFFIATGALDGGRMWNDSIVEALRLTRRDEIDLDGLGLAADAPLGGRHPSATAAQRRALIDRLLPAVKYLRATARHEAVARVVERAGIATEELPRELMMTSAQVRSLRRAGMQIGAHTVTHPILAALPAADARREMADSQRFLQTLLGEPVRLFAYPNGKPGRDFNDESVQIARELGFTAAFSTAPGTAPGIAGAGAGGDLFRIPRYTPWDRSRLRFGARLLGNLRT